MRIAWLLVLLLTSTAHAGGRFAFLAGGGLEGGTITGAPRPDGVAEMGFQLDWILPGRDWGFGVGSRRVMRLTDVGALAEVAADVTFRYERPDRKARFGVGSGARILVEDTDARDELGGYDFIRFEGAVQIAGTTAFSIDASLAWTFGCYSDSIEMPVAGDQLRAPAREVRCGETLTTTYVVGIATSFHWR